MPLRLVDPLTQASSGRGAFHYDKRGGQLFVLAASD